MQEEEEIDKQIEMLAGRGIFYGVEKYILRALYNKAE